MAASEIEYFGFTLKVKNPRLASLPNDGEDADVRAARPPADQDRTVAGRPGPPGRLAACADDAERKRPGDAEL